MKTILHFSIAFLVMGSSAHAIDYVIPADTSRTIRNTTVTDADAVIMQMEHNRSYCCQITSQNDANDPAVDFGMATISTGDLLDGSFRGSTSPYLGINSPSDEQRFCARFEEEVGNGRGFLTLPIVEDSPGVDSTISCSETTLFGGFNTSVTDFNFIEVSNTAVAIGGSTPIMVKLTADGVISGTRLVSTTFELNPGQRTDIDIHSSAPSDFGPVVITHNGPPGSIIATTAQYRIVTQSPLDFEPVSNVVFSAR